MRDENRRFGIPGCKARAPGMFRPAGRRDITVDVARLQPDPIHSREMSNRVAYLRVYHELGLGRGTRREVKLHQIVAPRFSLWLKSRRNTVAIFVCLPFTHWSPYDDAGVVFSQSVELRRAICVAHDVPHSSPFNAVGKI